MRYKKVFFGRTELIQIECPRCKTWQFVGNKCCECGAYLNKCFNDKEEDRPEFRSEVPTGRIKIGEKKKQKIYLRDDFTCQYCGVYCYDSWVNDPKALTIDHGTPIVGGGSNQIDNLITSCRECNLTKSDKRFDSFEEARKYILEKKKYNYIE
jgi:5-methylcytosine-specific restriction endonuclease McrA